MKKQLLFFACLAFTISTFSQEEKKEHTNKVQTDKGKWFIQSNIGGYFSDYYSITTKFDYDSSNDWSAGLSGGYFIKKNFAITAGLSYKKETIYSAGYYGSFESISYQLGAKYYFKNNIFVSADFGGNHINVPKYYQGYYFDPNVFNTGINVGYAWFIGKYLSIEPSVRYQYQFDKYYSNTNLNINLGVSIHF